MSRRSQERDASASKAHAAAAGAKIAASAAIRQALRTEFPTALRADMKKSGCFRRPLFAIPGSPDGAQRNPGQSVSSDGFPGLRCVPSGLRTMSFFRQPFFTRNVSWQPPHSLPTAGKFALSESRSLILPLASATTLAKLATLASNPALSSQTFGEAL